MDEEDEAPPMPPEMVLAAIVQAGNVADLLDEARLAGIAEDVLREHAIDVESMKPWKERMQRGIDLASLIKEEKSYPFDKAANVKYPLITTAALQFNARAYPAIVPNDEVVKVKTFGKDPAGQKAARAERVAAHMSWQLTSQVEEWEETVDELLTVLPIVGTMVRKVWFDPAHGRIRTRMVKPGCFVVNSTVKVLADAPRLGEILSLFPTEISERKRAGTFRDVDYIEAEGEDRDAAQEFVEQHRRLDLDDDGYPEPYIVTVHVKLRKVARIVADFGLEDVRLGPSGVAAIRRGSYFVPYHFLPAIDGGFFGTGLGFLLGDISETINTVINMMIDAGHMASRGGGFIGSEFRLKGGSHSWRPGEWKMVGAKGADIRSAVVPMTFPGADATLFQLLGLLIEAGKEVASVKDIMTGEAQRQMTATTTLALIEQGMAVFTAAYKRIFRALKHEFRLIARLNVETLDPQEYMAFHDQPVDVRADYNLGDMDIAPVADPRSVTKMQEAAKAQLLMELSNMGLVDRGAAAERVLAAASIGDTEALMPKPDPMAQAMQQLQIKAAEAEATLKMIEVDQALADIEKTRSETVKNLSQAGAQEMNARLDRAKLMLEAMRDGLGAALGRGAGGVAGASGHPAPAGRSGGAGGGPAVVGNGGLLVGPGMAGGGQAFGPAAGGIPGGPV